MRYSKGRRSKRLRVEATALVHDIERDLTGWFLFTREAISVNGSNNRLLTVRTATEMEGPSRRKLERLLSEVDGWGEFPGL